MKRKNPTITSYHIISRGGQWALVRENGSRATRVYPNKWAAIQAAKNRAGTSGGIVVHEKDGTVDFESSQLPQDQVAVAR